VEANKALTNTEELSINNILINYYVNIHFHEHELYIAIHKLSKIK